jgi:Fur family zinc uptake transcriptional regulator
MARGARNADKTSGPFPAAHHDHGRCIDDALAAAEDLCARNGQRLTPLRKRILEMVWQEHRPVGAYDLLDRLRGEHKGAAPPTVYRALDFLLENGLIHRIESLNAYVGCGTPEAPHSGQFLICRHCNRIAELDDGAIDDAVRQRAKRLGFQVESQTIEILGDCAECRQRQGDDGT